MNKKLFNDIISKNKNELTSTDYLLNLSEDTVKELQIYKTNLERKDKSKNKTIVLSASLVALGVGLGFLSPIWFISFGLICPAVVISEHFSLYPKNTGFALEEPDYIVFKKNKGIEKLKAIIESVDFVKYSSTPRMFEQESANSNTNFAFELNKTKTSIKIVDTNNTEIDTTKNEDITY